MDALSTGDVARACGVSPDTIRYYERRGVIAALRSASGQRRFPPETLRRVRVIRNAIAVGFTIDELLQFFSERSAGHPPCRRVRAAAEAKLRALDEKIDQMQTLRARLADVLGQWDRRLLDRIEGEPAHLLDSIPERSIV